LYLNGNDKEGHTRVLRYMLDNGLIRKTKSGKLYYISFKYDSQTFAGKYKGASLPER
jgi:dipeptidyl aminopeptidase/acylaminoacyl peptidase